MKQLYMVSLGCPKNLVDSEVMLGSLEQAGYGVTDIPEKAQVIVVNTCGFISPAVEEAIDTILEMAAYKEENPQLRLVVAGCLVQRYGASLVAELPEVDLFVGLDDFPRLGALLENCCEPGQILAAPGAATFVMSSADTRRLATPAFRSYLKINEGCDNRCSYCMIPSIRGRLRSRSIADLVQEAQQLEAYGVRELCLIAQDLTAYGRDLCDGTTLPQLLASLLAQTSIPWFRLLYAYPSSVSDDLLQCMAEQPRIVPYLDIPLQHVSDAVLKRMRRHYGYQDIATLMERIRRFLPDCALRTTFMVGFPGETPADIALLINSLKEWRFDHVGVFQYEDEEDCAAFQLSDKVVPEEKAARYEQVMTVQTAISHERLERFVGRVEPVLVEGESEESELLLEGRTRFQAPDIDGRVYITSGQMNPGDIVEMRITEAHTYDLVGQMVSTEYEE